VLYNINFHFIKLFYSIWHKKWLWLKQERMRSCYWNNMVYDIGHNLLICYTRSVSWHIVIFKIIYFGVTIHTFLNSFYLFYLIYFTSYFFFFIFNHYAKFITILKHILLCFNEFKGFLQKRAYLKENFYHFPLKSNEVFNYGYLLKVIHYDCLSVCIDIMGTP
jgi:hypothetical protein